MSDNAADHDLLSEALGELTFEDVLAMVRLSEGALQSQSATEESQRLRRKLERMRRSLEWRVMTASHHSPGPRAGLDDLRRELAALPVENPSDGFSARDHDDLLYGGRQ